MRNWVLLELIWLAIPGLAFAIIFIVSRVYGTEQVWRFAVENEWIVFAGLAALGFLIYGLLRLVDYLRAR